MTPRRICAIASRAWLAALLPMCLLAACAPASLAPACSFASVSRLYLGQATPTGTVTEAQWEAFVAAAVTPRFPEGFTVLSGQGQWRAPDGRIEKEDTRVIEIVHADDPLARARVRAVAAAYRQQFRQQVALMATSPSMRCEENAGA